jgi:hypothetical protein
MAGCGVGQGKISGTVKFDGKPLPGGRLMFFPQVEGLNSVAAVVDEQGNYQAELPACEVKVTVNNQELKPRSSLALGIPPGLRLSGEAVKKIAEKPQKATGTVDPGMHGRLPGKYVELPAKYYSVTTTPLSFTVNRGNQTHEIDLTK